MKKNINFFAVMREENRVRPNPVKVGIIVLLSVLAVGQLGFYIYQRGILSGMQVQLESNALMIVNPGVQETLSNNDLINDYLKLVETDLATTKALQKQLDTTTGFHAYLYQTVVNAAPADVTLQSFSFLQDTISITCTTGDNAPPSSYTVALIDTGLFNEVGYHGFSAISTEVQGQTVIVFPIVCNLKPLEVAEDDET